MFGLLPTRLKTVTYLYREGKIDQSEELVVDNNSTCNQCGRVAATTGIARLCKDCNVNAGTPDPVVVRHKLKDEQLWSIVSGFVGALIIAVIWGMIVSWETTGGVANMPVILWFIYDLFGSRGLFGLAVLFIVGGCGNAFRIHFELKKMESSY